MIWDMQMPPFFLLSQKEISKQYNAWSCRGMTHMKTDLEYQNVYTRVLRFPKSPIPTGTFELWCYNSYWEYIRLISRKKDFCSSPENESKQGLGEAFWTHCEERNIHRFKSWTCKIKNILVEKDAIVNWKTPFGQRLTEIDGTYW